MRTRHILIVDPNPQAEKRAHTLCGAPGPVTPTLHTRIPFCPDCKELRRQHRQTLRRIAQGLACPDCGAPLHHSAGCSFCHNCGWERC